MAIKLEKGQRINLEKSNGNKLQQVCIGVNWGAIRKKNWFGFSTTESVDLDASCAQFDANGNIIDKVWFRNLKSKDRAIFHSGDDLTGDTDGDDGLDNEVITVDLSKVNIKTEKIAFVLNSFRGHDFKTIPFASIRIYEGTPTKVKDVYATYDIANNPTFAGSVSMVMGIFYRHNGEWKFNAIGEATKDRDFESTLNTIKVKYL